METTDASSAEPGELTMSVVMLTVPAEPAYVRAVRLVAASLAADLGFDVERLEDVRVAVDELCSLFLPDTDDGAIELRFLPVDGCLEVTGRYLGQGRVTRVDPLVSEILDATTDELDVPTEELPAFRFVRRP